MTNEIKPLIKENKIFSLEVDGVQLSLVNPIPFDQLGKIVQVAEEFGKYFDLGALQSPQAQGTRETQWPPKELKAFVKSELREDQKVALDLLPKKSGKTRRNSLKHCKRNLTIQNLRDGNWAVYLRESP